MLGRFPEPRSLEDAAAAARQLAPAFGAVIVTAGAEGVGYSGPEGQLGIAGEMTAVASTHGAGDEFVGHLAASLARRAPIEEALRQANCAAARLVGTPEALRG